MKFVFPVIEYISAVFVPDKAPSNFPYEPTVNLVNSESSWPGSVSVMIFIVLYTQVFQSKIPVGILSMSMTLYKFKKISKNIYILKIFILPRIKFLYMMRMN